MRFDLPGLPKMAKQENGQPDVQGKQSDRDDAKKPHWFVKDHRGHDQVCGFCRIRKDIWDQPGLAYLPLPKLHGDLNYCKSLEVCLQQRFLCVGVSGKDVQFCKRMAVKCPKPGLCIVDSFAYDTRYNIRFFLYWQADISWAASYDQMSLQAWLGIKHLWPDIAGIKFLRVPVSVSGSKNFNGNLFWSCLLGVHMDSKAAPAHHMDPAKALVMIMERDEKISGLEKENSDIKR